MSKEVVSGGRGGEQLDVSVVREIEVGLQKATGGMLPPGRGVEWRHGVNVDKAGAGPLLLLIAPNTQRKKPPDLRLVRGFRGDPKAVPPRSLLFHLTGLPNRNKGSGSYPFLRLTLGPRLLGPGASYTLSPVPHCPAREPRGSVGPLPEAVRGGNLQAECTGWSEGLTDVVGRGSVPQC